jgi:UDP-N-acetylglucosamine acyltransferase
VARVHASAVVDPAARLAADVVVGPHVVVEGDVEVGPGTVLEAGTVLLDGSRVGARCRLGPHAVVGGRPMDKDHAGEASRAVLEDGVEARDFATVHRATGAGAETRVGAGALLMCYVHVSHNVRVGAGAVLTNLTQLGGHVEVGEHAVLGGAATVHQYVRVGAYAMLGAASYANRDVLPFALARGNPARHYRLNAVGLRRNGIAGQRYRVLERALRALRHGDGAALAELADASADVARLAAFHDASRRGVAGFRTAP